MSFSQKLLSLLPPETAHNIGKWAMKHRLGARGPYRKRVMRSSCSSDDMTLDDDTVKLFGIKINNPLGLAAGFDKNGELVDVVEGYGFGFVEVGSVTLFGGKGNPKPRMFRLADTNDNGYGIMNRMGLNGDPAYIVRGRLEKHHFDRINWCTPQPGHAYDGPYGVNIAKTHHPDIIGDRAITDIVETYRLLCEFGAYTVINISCPNTREGKTFEEPAALKELLGAVRKTPEAARAKPLLVKFSPTLGRDAGLFDDLIQVCKDLNVSGYVFCNTLPTTHPEYGKGGLSGSRVKAHALQLIKWARQIYKVTEPIIACGGIFTGQDVLDYKAAGANFFQAYNGFVRGPNAGPKFARTVLRDAEFTESIIEAITRSPQNPYRDDELEQTSLGQDIRGKTSLD